MTLNVTFFEAKRIIGNEHNLNADQVVLIDDNPPTGDNTNGFLSAIANGRKLDAIKVLRQVRGCGLKEAKDAVDAFYNLYYSIPQL
jgi:ribosomal protein L7/L12